MAPNLKFFLVIILTTETRALGPSEQVAIIKSLVYLLRKKPTSLDMFVQNRRASLGRYPVADDAKGDARLFQGIGF